MDKRTTARFQLLAAALLFSTGGAAIKACGLTGWQISGFRSGVAAVALWIMLPSARRGWTWRTGFVALAYAATLILYVLANKLTTAANAIFLQSTAPLYLLLVAPLLLREAVRPRDVGFMAALAVGLGLFFTGQDAPQETAPDPLMGNLLGVCSALTWALTVAGLRWLARAESGDGGRGTAGGAALLGNVFVFLIALPLALPVAASRPLDWALIAFLGVFQIALAYVFLTKGVTRIGALEGALLLLVEPVLNTLWAWLVHGEVPGLAALLGALVILTATAVHALVAARANRT